ncbi:MAG TPA: OmpA family protein [Polyangiaceae bacterium]|nr:OmpA family protein [Polyangiaceae bacterium]
MKTRAIDCTKLRGRAGRGLLAVGITVAVSFCGARAQAEGSAQTGTDNLMAESVLHVDVLNGDDYLNIAARNDENNATVVVTVTAPDGTSTDYNLTNGNGRLTSTNQPASIADPLRIAVTPGVYDVQFDHAVVPYDVSVSANDTDPIDPAAVPAGGGRLFSTDWRFQGSLNTASPDYAFFVRAPVLDAEYVWKLNLQGLAGGYMCLVANDLGLPGTLARSSQTNATLEAYTGLTLARLDYCDDLAHYEMYVNPPNNRKAQPGTPELEFVGIPGCGAVLEGAGGSFEFTASLPSTYAIVIDTDKNGVFDPISSDAVISGAATAGTNIVQWDGKDGSGATVPASATPYPARLYLRLGEFHFTAVDVETADPGISVELVDPVSLVETSATMFWDDRAIAANGEPDPDETLPDGTTSAHHWGDFSGDNGVGNNNYLDTWVIGKEVTQDVQVTVSDPTADADGDGLINGRECEIGSIFDNPDTDADGVPDGEEAPATGTITDTDGDMVGDVFDTDDDGDGIPTTSENVDPNQDDSATDAQDSDTDGVPDYLDTDDDGDGIPTADEDLNDDQDYADDDTDDDGIPNYLDTDDDGDGLPTADEDLNDDQDYDDDNTDSDGIPNYLDPDDDGDGIPTDQEIEDAGNDPDFDGDGDPNWLDPDSDGDGIPDATEAAGNGDSNNDGVPDYLDPANAPQDTDGDGIPDSSECAQQNNCPDSDGDGTVNTEDPDDDGDGVPTSVERPEGQDVDTDDDGTPDYLDPDDDNDGVPTATERPGDQDVDTDDDGTPDYLDPDDDGDGLSTRDERPNGSDIDTDGDGTPDYLDPDSGVAATDAGADAGAVLPPPAPTDTLTSPSSAPSEADAGATTSMAPDAGPGNSEPSVTLPETTPTSAPEVDAGAPPQTTSEPDAGSSPTKPTSALPDNVLEGGGCSCRLPGANTQTSQPWLGLLGAALIVARRLGRRRRAITRADRAGSKLWRTIASKLAVLGLLFASATWASSARAQAGGIALDRFDPAERGSDWFNGESLDLRGHNRWAAGGTLDWGYKPLVAYDADGDEAAAVVRHQMYLHLGGAVVLWDRLRFGANLPLLVVESGDPATSGGANYQTKKGVALGDLRLGADVRLFGTTRDLATMAFGAQFFVPTGSRDSYASDGKVRIVPRVMLAGEAGDFAYAARVSSALRTRTDNFAGQPFGAEMQFGVAAGLRFDQRHWLVGPELWGSTVVSDGGDGFFEKKTTPLEGVIGAHYFLEEWRFGAGFGPGLTRGIGAPEVRVLASAEWFAALPPPPAPPADTDGDGIWDSDDACVKVPGVASTDPHLNGCPKPEPPKDSDGDGIIDPKDACVHVPGEPNEDLALNGCPPKDSDGDKILDRDDACPHEPGVESSVKEKNGCPLPKDSDGDGINDELDACPAEPGPADPDPKLNGCPRAQVQGQQIVILDRVEFDTNKATIRPESDGILQAVLKVLQDHTELAKVRIEGHTDNRGGKNHNLTLSRKRAAAVVQWLVAHGIDAKRVSSEGVGPNRPIADNATEEGRQTNRRVEFHIVSEGK